MEAQNNFPELTVIAFPSHYINVMLGKKYLWTLNKNVRLWLESGSIYDAKVVSVNNCFLELYLLKDDAALIVMCLSIKKLEVLDDNSQ
jgi:hypothetical protein